MLLYFVANAVTSEPDGRRIVQCTYYGDNLLPVFTSPESLWCFLEASAAKMQEPDHRVCVVNNPFELAELVGSFEANGLEFLFFDPLSSPDGDLWTWGNPIPASEYRASIEEIRPQFEKLGAEAVAQFCRPSHLEAEPFVRWRTTRVEEIASDLRARMEEWIV